MVVRVARRYHQLELTFYIITFYDTHSAAVISALEDEDLPSDCVCNVDSLQGAWRSPYISFVSSLRLSSLTPNRHLVKERKRLRDGSCLPFAQSNRDS